MKVAFASSDWSGSVFDDNGHPVWGGAGFIRLGQYVNNLEAEVVCGVLAHQNGIFGVRDWAHQFHWDCDVIVMQRVMFEDIPDKMDEAKASGQIIINDLDDWYWGLSPLNGAFKASHPKYNKVENVNHYRNVMARSSLVTTSTPYLKQRLAQWVNCPIIELPNCVEVKRFIRHEDSGSEVPLVGWVGSTSHRSGDLEILRGILEPLVKRGKIRLHHSGHHSQAKTFAEGVNVDPKYVTTMPMASPQYYPTLLCFDIGIVPLSDLPFNRAKSAIKGIEYASAGIPFIASDLDAYKDLHATYALGRLASKPSKWIQHIEKLCDPEVRQAEGELGLKNVDKCDIRFGIRRWNALLASLK